MSPHAPLLDEEPLEPQPAPPETMLVRPAGRSFGVWCRGALHDHLCAPVVRIHDEPSARDFHCPSQTAHVEPGVGGTPRAWEVIPLLDALREDCVACEVCFPEAAR